jgi:hypothetical protein
MMTFTITSMDDRPPESAFVTRTAIRLGHTLGLWRRRRLEAAQNKFVETWKAAWTEGCEAAWHGTAIGAVPYRRGRRRDAWHAGWHWATTNPGPRSDNGAGVDTRIYRRGEDPALRAAAGGAVGLTVVAAARWLWRARRKTAPPEVKGES